MGALMSAFFLLSGIDSNSRVVHWGVWGGLTLVILAIGFAYVREQRANPGSNESSPALPLPIYSTVGDFSLTNQLGQPVGLNSLKGKVWLADIIFTRCAGPCPLMTRRMARLQEKFAEWDEVRFVTLTTDPLHDTPEVMGRFAKKFGAKPVRWEFLTGDKKEIIRMAVGGLKLITQEKPEAEQSNPEDLFIHTTIFVAVDRQGRVRGTVESIDDGWEEKAVLLVETLLKETKK